MTTLGEVVGSKGIFTDGDWILSENMDNNGEIAVIQLKHIGEGEFLDHKDFKYITQDTFDDLNCTEVYTGDLLISRMADPIARSVIVPRGNNRYVTAVDISIVRVDETVASISYLNFLCNSFIVREQAEALGRGTTRLRITRTALEKIKIPLPPLDEQKRIASILEEADRARRTRRFTDGVSDSFLQEVFVEMFGDTQCNPYGFAVKTLGELCNKITDGTHQPPKFVYEGLPFLFVSNIVDGEINFDTKKYISEKTYNELTRNTKIEVNDILYSSVGSFGVAVQVKSDRKFAFQRHIAHLKPNSSKIDPTFLRIQMNTYDVYRQADEFARGVAQRTINLREIRQIRVLVPPQELQYKFAEIVQQYERILHQQQESARQAEHLFQTLLHQAFRGEL